ncbi:MAG: diguanylate cyclase [Thermosynechococcaceae cyanobacterium]
MPLLRRKIPLWSVWVVPFVFLTFAAVGLVGYLSLKNGQQAVNDLAQQLMDKTSQQVDDHLDSYLAIPLQLTKMNIQAIADGTLDIRNPRTAERYFWRQSVAFPSVGFVGFSRPDGTEIGAGRWLSRLAVLLYENFPGPNNSADYLSDIQGNRTKQLWTYEYEPTALNFYQDAVRAGKLIWTGVDVTGYPNVKITPEGQAVKTQKKLSLGNEAYATLSASAPFYDKQGRLLGVISTDFLLTQLSDFLRTVKFSQGGRTFILEHNRQGALIASSTQSPIAYQQRQEIRRYTLFDSPHPLLRAIAPHIQSQARDLEHHKSKTFKIEYNQQPYYIQLTHWHDKEHGLDWLVVVTVPESDFMAQIHANTRQTVLLCLGALGIATGLGVLTARWVTRPMSDLNRASQAIAAGDLQQQVGDSPIQEIDTVRQSFNQMAAQLHASFSQMSYTATHDKLTGLNNRLAFQQKLTECIERHQGGRRSLDLFAVLVLDLDFFKLVNDSLGHLAGDQLLVEVSQRLQRCIRTQDTLARFGGDEFVMLLEPINHPKQAVQVVERILEELKKPFLLNEKTAFISTSVGIVLGSEQSHTTESPMPLK